MRKLAPLLLFIFYIALLTVVSLFSFGKISSVGTEWDDKLHHIVAHALLTYLAFNYYKHTKIKNSIFIAVLTSIVYGIIIEVLQLTITEDRTFDLIDLVANFVGASFTFLFLNFKGYLKLK